MVSIVAKSDTFDPAAQPNSPRVAQIVRIGDPSVTGTALTTWGIPVVDAPVPLPQYMPPAGFDPLQVWRTQPSVRKVVDFIARQCASVPWHAYIRVSDTDRKRVNTSAAETQLMGPRRFVTGYSLWHKVVVDMCLYDAWCVALLPEPDGSLKLTRIPPRLLDIRWDTFGNIEQVLVRRSGDGDSGDFIDITDEKLAISTGWASDRGNGVSPMVTLSAILRENLHAIQWQDDQWRNGPKTTGVLSRPAGAPKWEKTSRERFVQSWRAYRDSKSGGTPILEDGMTYSPVSNVSPSDAQVIQARQLTDVEVSSAFHIPPELVGARAGNFSNIAAFRQMLFGPALGPRLEELQQGVNAEIVPELDGTPGLYVELDRETAMNGSFLEQATVLSTSTGGPWLTRNEARSKQNLPALAGGDELVTPLNVSVGGQASPQDSGSQNRTAGTDPNAETVAPKSVRGPLVLKAATVTARTDLEHEIADLFRQQTAELNVGAKVDPDEFHRQWDATSAAAVKDHLFGSAATAAQHTLQQIKAPDGVWSADVMRKYIAAMAGTVGGGIAKTAIDHINADEWPPDPVRPDDGPAHAGLVAALVTSAGTWAASALADAAGFGAHDGAHAAGAQTKTWVTGPNPRPEHAAINGETVAMDDEFSIGVRWPGDSVGEPDATVNCNCSVEFQI